MSVTMRSLETAVPATTLHQAEVRDALAGQPDRSRLGQRLVAAAFDFSGLARRPRPLTGWAGPAAPGDSAVVAAETGRFLNPTTGVRNQVYEREATALSLRVADQALRNAEGLGPADVTHVLTVSCTGFFSPGPDYRIVRALGLAP